MDPVDKINVTPLIRVAWLVKSLGYNNKLLYWEPILKGFVRTFPTTKIWTYETETTIKDTVHVVENISNICYSNRFMASVYKLYSYKPNIVIISEFGICTIAAIIYKIFNPSTKILLLVENDPKYLKRNGINRTNWVHKLFRKWVCRQATLVITNNNEGHKYLSEILCVDSCKSRVSTYLTSSLSVNLRKKRILGQSKLRLLFVGRLTYKKGVHAILEALSQIPEDIRINIIVNIVGDGPERKQLMNLAIRYDLQETVIFHGAVSYENINNYYCDNDVFLFPTLADYRSLVAFEAISVGLPIIGSIHDGSTTETIISGKNGFVVDPDRIDSLKDAILWFINNKDSIALFSNESLILAKKYTVTIATSNIISACFSCIESQ